MTITLTQAKNLQFGDMLHHTSDKNYDGTMRRWRVNGKPKTWKMSPQRVEIPVKFGLYTYDTLTQDHLHLVDLA